MNKRYLRIGAALGLAAVLGACGGSDDGPVAQGQGPGGTTPNPTTPGVPSSATQSVTGLVAFLNELIGRTSETTEPIMLGDAVLPTTEADPPIALN